MLLTIAMLIYIAFYVTGSDMVFNIKMFGIKSCTLIESSGICTCFGLIVLIGMLQFRDGPFIRPHPAFWRIVLGITVCYQLILTFVLFQNKHDIRRLLQYFDSSLGVPLPEKSYADNCALTQDNIVVQDDSCKY